MFVSGAPSGSTPGQALDLKHVLDMSQERILPRFNNVPLHVNSFTFKEVVGNDDWDARNDSSEGYSISAWIKPRDFNRNYFIAQNNAWEWDRALEIGIRSNKLFLSHGDGQNLYGKTILPDYLKNDEDGWVHVFFKYEGGSNLSSIYLDGVLEDSKVIDEPRFKTVDGKAHFRVPRSTNWTARSSDTKDLVLTSVRSEGQFNTIVYDEADRYRNQTHRNVLFMSEQDVRLRGMQAGELVNVESNVGKMAGLVLAVFDIKPGNVMTYFPEANVLVPQRSDPRSKTPSFKSVRVSVCSA